MFLFTVSPFEKRILSPYSEFIHALRQIPEPLALVEASLCFLYLKSEVFFKKGENETCILATAWLHLESLIHSTMILNRMLVASLDQSSLLAIKSFLKLPCQVCWKGCSPVMILYKQLDICLLNKLFLPQKLRCPINQCLWQQRANLRTRYVPVRQSRTSLCQED